MKSITMVSKIITPFARLSDAGLLAKALVILGCMTGNIYFPTPAPTQDVLADAITAFQDALNSASGRDSTQVILKNQARMALIALLKSLGNYVTFTAEGDPAKNDSSGFDLRKILQPVIVQKPTVKVENGTNSGKLVIGALYAGLNRGFVQQYTPAPLIDDSMWNSFPSTSKKFTFTGLRKGQEYYCRIGLVGGKGQLVFSDPVSRIVQ